MSKRLKEFLAEFKKHANPKKAKDFQRFFKTTKGDYGFGVKFLGIMVPVQRKIAREFLDLALKDLAWLLKSEIHEHRLTALIILVKKFNLSDKQGKEQIGKFYLENARLVNNWDLVDTSARYILGPLLLHSNKKIIYKLVLSNNLWERRIAVLTTFHFIVSGQYADTLKLAKILLNDEHDLIHKAVGWMLREIGNRSSVTLKKFLDQNYKIMPRTMLRYAIEKLPETKRQFYLKK